MATLTRVAGRTKRQDSEGHSWITTVDQEVLMFYLEEKVFLLLIGTRLITISPDRKR